MKKVALERALARDVKHFDSERRIRVDPARETSLARRVVDALRAHGVDTFFGVPGGPVSPFFEAIFASDATLVESRQESAAAFAAAGYYRRTGKVAAVVVTAGPGTTHAITGIASAFADHTPMIVIAGDVAWQRAQTPLVQDSGPNGIHTDAILAPITRSIKRLRGGENVGALVAAAYATATTPRRGPAVLIVPVQVALEQGPARPLCLADIKPVKEPMQQEVAAIAKALSSAKRPLLVLGHGTRHVREQVRHMVDTVSLPFATTPTAKGTVSEKHPRSLRTLGLGASLWGRAYCAERPDVVVALGTDLDDCSIDGTPLRTAGARVIRVDHDADCVAVPGDVVVHADAGTFALALAREWSSNGYRNTDAVQALRSARAGASMFADETADDVLSPQRALNDLQETFGVNANYVSDIGEHMLFALHYLTIEKGSFALHLPFGSMGSGICGAIGQALSREQVICICGDGGMQMSGMEVLVAAQLKLPVVFAVFNDARYGMVYHGFKHAYGREAPWETPWVDFVGWARSMDVPAVRISRPGQLTKALVARVQREQGPLILDMRIERTRSFPATSRNDHLRRLSMGEEKQ
jgi:acetolactate synthase I/II/III large subunit